MINPLKIGLQGTFGVRGGGTRLPFGGRGFAGAAKRIERVKEDVADLLFQMEGTEGLVASYHDGVIRLTGEVANEDDALRIKAAIWQVPGVTDVRMAARIVPAQTIRPASIERDLSAE